MRQVMPHRNNIELRRTKIKRYFSIRWKNRLRPWRRRRRSRRRQTRSGRELAARTGICMIILICRRCFQMKKADRRRGALAGAGG